MRQVSVRRSLAALIALVAVVVAAGVPWRESPPAGAQSARISRSGVLGGARYQIEVPPDWRGGLVVFAHGIQRGPGPADVAAPPLALHILDRGHAWAASGFRARNYRPDWFIEDLLALRAWFLDLVAWIERGVRPQGDDVLASDLSRIGLAWTPVLHPDDPLAGAARR